jgi:long-subunit fatty acid transport protein
MRRIAAVPFLVCACLAGFGPEAAAQPVPEQRLGQPPVQYTLAPPGARSLAMGASFIGLADDATASESNPAGLTILTRPEVSAHFRYSEFENDAPNTVTGTGFEPFTSRVGSPSFFSVVYPWKQAAVSFYYQRAADYRARSSFDDLLPDFDYNLDVVELLFRTENIGVSGAFKIGDKVSVGASIRGTRVRLDSTQSVSIGGDPADIGFLSLFRNVGSLEESKFKATFNAGVLVSPSSKFSIGGVYKKGESFDFTQTLSASLETPFGDVSESEQQPVDIAVPDVYGGGVAIRPNDRLTLVADVVRIEYADGDPGPNALNLYQRFGQGGREAIENATEIHAGVEYTFTSGNDWIFSVRGGYYFDPDHDGLAGLDSDQNHATLGGGVVVRNKLQVDVAANIASAVKEGLISFVVRF